MIVVDTNVIAYTLIEGDKTALAQEVANIDPDWKVPALWRHEFLNVLATSARAGIIDAQQAEMLWNTGLDLLGHAEREIDGSAALRIAIEHGVSAYDAQYIALAKNLETLCVTEDKRMLKTFPDITVSMKAFCA